MPEFGEFCKMCQEAPDNLKSPEESATFVKTVLTQSGLSEEGFARALGVSTETVHAWLDGSRLPEDGILTILRLAYGNSEFLAVRVESDLKMLCE